jgi:hypothetical protein
MSVDTTIITRHHLLRSFACIALAALGGAAHADEREAPPVREVQEIPLPGVQGRLDHFTIDVKRERVIFSGLGNQIICAMMRSRRKSTLATAKAQLA